VSHVILVLHDHVKHTEESSFKKYRVSGFVQILPLQISQYKAFSNLGILLHLHVLECMLVSLMM